MRRLSSYVFIKVFLLGFYLLGSPEPCPGVRSASQCMCFNTGTGSRVDCSNLESLEEIKHSLRQYQNHSIDFLTIRDSKFKFLPYDMFQGIFSVKHLTIANSEFSRIGNLGEPQFKGLENSLETLNLEKTFSRQNPLPFLQLNHLKKLTTLDVRDSHVNVLHNRWLREGPESLEVVRFTNDKLRAIGHEALSNLKNLRTIDLSENDLNYIPRWAFPEPAIFLKDINLERNKLEALPEDFFTQMPNLAKVNLELNLLSTIDETTWKNVWEQLNYINIDYNPMICDHKLKWILEEKCFEEGRLVGTCFKPFNLMDRDIHSLKREELELRK